MAKITYSPKVNNYLNQLKSGKAAKDKAKIINDLLNGPKTLEHFILMGFKVQTVSARLSDLEDEGIITKTDDEHGSFSWFHLENNEKNQLKNMRKKAQNKHEKWIKNGYSKGYIDTETFNTLTNEFNLKSTN